MTSTGVHLVKPGPRICQRQKCPNQAAVGSSYCPECLVAAMTRVRAVGVRG